MPRASDYRINDLGSKSPYSIVLNDLGLMFFGDQPIRGKFGPGEINQTNNPGEYPILFNDYSNGMGMAYSGIQNTYAFAINGYSRTKRKFMPGGLRTEVSLAGLALTLTKEIRGAIEWRGDIYLGVGHNIVKMTAGNGVISNVYTVGALDCQIDSALVYNNIPLFSTDQKKANWQYLTGYDGTAWKTANANGTVGTYSVRTGAGNYALYPKPVYLEKMKKIFTEIGGVVGNRIVGNNSYYTVIQTQSLNINEVIGNEDVYLAPVQVGDSTYAITNIFETNRFFAVAKVDGIYGVENGGASTPNYTPTWRENPSTFNGVSGMFIGGKLMVGTYQGVEMLDLNNRARIDIPQLISPSFFFANETPIFGIPTAMTHDNGWTVVSLWNGVDSHICYFRPRDETDAEKTNAPVIWHGSECTIPGQRVTMLLKTSVTGRPMMLIGSHDGVNAHLYWLSLPREGDPFTDYLHNSLHGTQGHEFALESRLYLPFQDADDPNAKKFVRRFDIQADGLTYPIIDAVTGNVVDTVSAAELDFYANADAGSRLFFEQVQPSALASEWSYQGIITTSPKASMLPTSTATSGSQIGILVVGRLINHGTTTLPAYSPFAVRSIKVRADLSIEQLEQKTYTVSLGHLQATKTGRDHGDITRKFGALTALQDANTVYLIDEHGERVVVKVEPGLKYYLKKEDVQKPYTYVVEFDVTYVGRQFIYDIGEPFDSVYSWGA